MRSPTASPVSDILVIGAVSKANETTRDADLTAEPLAWQVRE